MLVGIPSPIHLNIVMMVTELVAMDALRTAQLKMALHVSLLANYQFALKPQNVETRSLKEMKIVMPQILLNAMKIAQLPITFSILLLIPYMVLFARIMLV